VKPIDLAFLCVEKWPVWEQTIETRMTEICWAAHWRCRRMLDVCSRSSSCGFSWSLQQLLSPVPEG